MADHKLIELIFLVTLFIFRFEDLYLVLGYLLVTFEMITTSTPYRRGLT